MKILKFHISAVPIHCVKCVQIQSFFWSVFSPNAGKCGPEKTSKVWVMGFLTLVTLRLSAISELLKFHKLFPRVSFPLSCKEKTKKRANTFVCVTLSSLNKLYSLILPKRKPCFFWFLIGLILLKFKFFFYLDSFGDRPFFEWSVNILKHLG